MIIFVSRRKSPSPSPRRHKSRSISPRRRKSRSVSPRRRKSRSPAQRRYRRKRSRSITSSPISKAQSPHLGAAENKNAIDKQRLEEEKKRWGVSTLLHRVYITFYDHTSCHTLSHIVLLMSLIVLY